MPDNRTMSGKATQDDCSVYTDEAYMGCGVTFTEADSYGPTFNAAGGGWCVSEPFLFIRRTQVILLL